jgi:hypothetical protein
MTAPSAGARYVLERHATGEKDGLAYADYTAEIATPTVTYRAALTLREDGTFDLAPLGEPAPEALHKTLAMFAKLTARSAPARRTEGVPVWPARVTRWRAI